MPYILEIYTYLDRKWHVALDKYVVFMQAKFVALEKTVVEAGAAFSLLYEAGYHRSYFAASVRISISNV